MDFLRYLFNLIEKKENIYKIKFTNKEHPVFAAHFPNSPILPGFLQIEIAQKLINKKFKKIKKAKFIDIILPLDIVEFIHEIEKNKILIFKNKKKITEFLYE